MKKTRLEITMKLIQKFEFGKALMIALLLQCASCGMNTKEFKGGAWLNSDEIIRGMDISICTPTAIKDMQALLSQHQQEFFKKDFPSDMFLLYYNVAKENAKADLVKTFNSLSDSKQCLTKTSTDIEGKYTFFPSVKEIDSHPQLFAYSQDGYWVILLSKNEDDKRIDLNRQNMNLILKPSNFEPSNRHRP